MIRFGYIGALLFAALLACAQPAPKPLRIVTTFLPAYCFAANLAGDQAQVENLLPGTVSLHDYQLTPADIRRLSTADVIVINGLGMEAFLDKALANSGPDAARKIVQLTDGFDRDLIDGSGHAHEDHAHAHARNPHIWLDPTLAIRSVTNMLRALETRDPSHAPTYQQNAAKYIERLRVLDQEMAKALQPLRNVPFITYHSAFPYFARRYGLTLAGVVEQVPEVPPSPKEMSRLLQLIRTQEAKALFTQPGSTTRLAQQIARDTGIKLAELDPLETGPLDPLTYERGMRRNMESLKKALSE